MELIEANLKEPDQWSSRTRLDLPEYAHGVWAGKGGPHGPKQGSVCAKLFFKEVIRYDGGQIRTVILAASFSRPVTVDKSQLPRL